MYSGRRYVRCQYVQEPESQVFQAVSQTSHPLVLREPPASRYKDLEEPWELVSTYGVAVGTVLENPILESIREVAPGAELDHRVPEHDKGLNLGVQLLRDVVCRGVHHARAL